MHLKNLSGLLVLLAIGCSGEPAKETSASSVGGKLSVPAGGIEYNEIIDSSSASRASVDLCTCVRHPMFVGWGLYRVDRLTGRSEEDLGNPGTISGFTYVDLTLIDGWYQAEKHPIVRTIGGPFGKDTGGWDVSLVVGETVGLFLTTPRPRDRNFYGVEWLGLFHQRPDGGFSNGQLFTKKRVDAQELGGLVKGLAGGKLGDPCPYNEEPDYLPRQPVQDPLIPPSTDDAGPNASGDAGTP